jgi:N-acetylmuramoyl-L-alanine amidase
MTCPIHICRIRRFHAPGVLTACLAILLAVTGGAAASGMNVVQSVTHQQTGRGETVTITMSRPVSFKSRFLDRNVRHNQPYRLFIDLLHTSPLDTAGRVSFPETSIIRRIRTALHDTTTTRIVFDLKRSILREQYSLQQLDNPPRIIITFAPGTKRSAPAAARAGHPSATTADADATDVAPAPEDSLTPPEPPIPRTASKSSTKSAPKTRPARSAAGTTDAAPYTVVIDPGHGGRDPGAIGFRGLKEKYVALALSRELHAHLNSLPGYKAVLTRSTDIFVSLDDRAAIANAGKADVFISLHANSHTDSHLMGIETYYLNFSSDESARKVAARENFTTAAQVSDLEMILFDLMQSDKINRSSILAGYIHNSLIAGISAAYTDYRNLGIKHAPMRVLIDAEMPCVLIEAAFISNPTEAKRLQNPTYQKVLARAIAEGIERFKNGHRTALYSTGE